MTTTTHAWPRPRHHGHAPLTPPLLQLIWLASPALPVGGFSYSEGLEAAVEAGLVHDEDSAGDWLRRPAAPGLARADLAVVAQAIAAWRAGDMQRIAQLDAWVLQTRETSELRQQTEQMGRSLVEWLRSRSQPRRARRRLRLTADLPADLSRRLRARRRRAPAPPPRDIAAGLRLRLGREHDAGRDQVRAARPERRPAHPGAAGRARSPPPSTTPLALDDDERQAFTPDAGHPVGAARNPILPPVPLMTTALHHIPAAPRNCRRCAWASAARSAPARPRCWRCCARPCASATTWSPSPTTSTPRKTSAC